MDTIVALATFPSSSSALNIVRVSGSSSRDIIDEIFIPKFKRTIQHHEVCYGNIVNKTNHKLIDEVILLPFFSPNSFTGEDLFEIVCHGGNVIYKQIISLITSHGARFAESGEFTKRAYINNKIDLSQAEAINSIVNSENEVALEFARKNLKGALGAQIEDIRSGFTSYLTQLETRINFPEDENVALSSDILNKLIVSLHNVLSSSAFQEDINIEDVVIIGEPNVGKSSLLNCLSGQEKSIVTDISGTTRDLIEHYVTLSGIKVKLVDTAGINNESQDIVERIGIDKALTKLAGAHTVLYMIDAAVPFDNKRFASFYEKYLLGLSATIIFLINKMDIGFEPDLSLLQGKHTVISISIKSNQNIDKVKDAVLASIDRYSEDILGKSFFLNKRQHFLLEQSLSFLQEAKVLLELGESDEVVASIVRVALVQLEMIVGKVSDEEMLDSIFSNFCIGK